MKRLTDYIDRNPWILYGVAILLFFPALMINLGLFPLISDEHIRGLVALEMLIRDEYVVPTMYGEYYLKKPPLFNWILIGFTQLTGSFNEYSLRLPTILATFLFGLSIFLFLRKRFTAGFAFVNALVFVTCGRMLFWDTQLALIDITFSWVVFMGFAVVYTQFRKGNFLWLFLLSYLLTAIAYMFKGLPALVFQGTTLLVFFVAQKQFKKLFSWQHLAGILLFLLLTGGYYLLFLARFNGNLEDIFVTLFGETTRRTVLRFGWERTIHHFVLFPFDMLYHFLPWSLLMLFLVDFRKLIDLFTIRRARLYACLLVAGIIVYALTYKSHPHQALLLIPVNLVLFLLAYGQTPAGGLQKSMALQIKYSLMAALLTIPLILASFFVDPDQLMFKVIQYSVSIVIFVLLFISVRLIIAFKYLKSHPLISFAALVFIANIVVYWTSPEVHPRYILMLAPLFFMAGLYVYFYGGHEKGFYVKLLEKTFLVMSVIVTLGCWSLLFIDDTRHLDHILIRTLALFVALAVFTWLYYKLKTKRLLIFGIILLVVRIGFNWTVMEARTHDAHETVSRAGAITLAEISKGHPLYLFKDSWIDDFGAFYITRERKELLTRKYDSFRGGEYYIVDERHIRSMDFDPLFQYRIVWEKKPVTLVRLSGNTPLSNPQSRLPDED